MTITESKKFSNEDGSFHYKKHKIYLYKEDFDEFAASFKEVSDFIFDWAPNSGWLDLWGIESPGLTACFAISEHVYQMLHKKNMV